MTEPPVAASQPITVLFFAPAAPGWRAVFDSVAGTLLRDVAAWAVIEATPPDTGHTVVALVPANVTTSSLVAASSFPGFLGVAAPGETREHWYDRRDPTLARARPAEW